MWIASLLIEVQIHDFYIHIRVIYQITFLHSYNIENLTKLKLEPWHYRLLQSKQNERIVLSTYNLTRYMSHTYSFEYNENCNSSIKNFLAYQRQLNFKRPEELLPIRFRCSLFFNRGGSLRTRELGQIQTLDYCGIPSHKREVCSQLPIKWQYLIDLNDY